MVFTQCRAWRQKSWNILCSPRLALFVLICLAAYIGIASWLPWTLDRTAKAPGWAVALGMDRPFSSVPFLCAVFLLFLNTLACTLQRTGRVWALVNGKIPHNVLELSCSAEGDYIDFLKEQGFRTDSGPPYFRNRFALTKGWLFHVGIVALLTGILVQQAYYDGGSFEIAEGEIVHLSDAGAVFDRKAGIFAPANPPDLEIALDSFDPFLHQKGYAPDRASTLTIRTRDAELRVVLDRAHGVSANGVSIFQAIPFGIAVTVEIEGLGLRSLHLRQDSKRRAIGEFKNPSGETISLSVEAEKNIDDPLGTGPLRFFLHREGKSGELMPGIPFLFGDHPAKIITANHWSGFTYSRSPGVTSVFLGFFLILAGTAVMLIPAGIAVPGRNEVSGALRVHLTRGMEEFVEAWNRWHVDSDKIMGAGDNKL